MRLLRRLHFRHQPVLLTRKCLKPECKDSGGYFSPSDRHIYLSPDTPRPEQAVALLHEVVHLALDEAKVELSLEKEESVCNAVSQCFAELIVRNPNLVPWLMESLGKGIYAGTCPRD